METMNWFTEADGTRRRTTVDEAFDKVDDGEWRLVSARTEFRHPGVHVRVREYKAAQRPEPRSLGVGPAQYAKRVAEGRCGFCGAFDGQSHVCPDDTMDAREGVTR